MKDTLLITNIEYVILKENEVEFYRDPFLESHNVYPADEVDLVETLKVHRHWVNSKTYRIPTGPESYKDIKVSNSIEVEEFLSVQLKDLLDINQQYEMNLKELNTAWLDTKIRLSQCESAYKLSQEKLERTWSYRLKYFINKIRGSRDG